MAACEIPAFFLSQLNADLSGNHSDVHVFAPNGTTIWFSCRVGEYLSGSETLNCLNGTWLEDFPICKRINECASTPCFNGAVCIDGTLWYNCSCPSGFHGLHCEFVAGDWVGGIVGGVLCFLFLFTLAAAFLHVCLHARSQLKGYEGEWQMSFAQAGPRATPNKDKIRWINAKRKKEGLPPLKKPKRKRHKPQRYQKPHDRTYSKPNILVDEVASPKANKSLYTTVVENLSLSDRRNFKNFSIPRARLDSGHLANETTLVNQKLDFKPSALDAISEEPIYAQVKKKNTEVKVSFLDFSPESHSS